ncbi:MAG: DUF2752 domain-containing protein [Xanthomonadaceae bacterium]|jgi:hypothetical protein|nr:DUF2752 domain-containing protein [Xanthomonadaceae bacterium]
MPLSHKSRIAVLALVAATGAGAGWWLFLRFDPHAADSPFPPCLFYSLTHYYCVGCGITRALHALAHGHIGQALAMNPLFVLLLLVSPLVAADMLGWRSRHLQPLMRWFSAPAFWLILLPAYWVARNLPWFPFTALAPG